MVGGTPPCIGGGAISVGFIGLSGMNGTGLNGTVGDALGPAKPKSPEDPSSERHPAVEPATTAHSTALHQRERTVFICVYTGSGSALAQGSSRKVASFRTQ